MSNDEIKRMQDQVNTLEAAFKSYESNYYILQTQLEFQQKNYHADMNKWQSQLVGLVTILTDYVKENHRNIEARETQLLQKLNTLLSLNDDYSSLGNLNAGNVSMTNDANSLINGTIASLTGGGNSAILPSSSRMSSNDQLLTPGSLHAQNQLLGQTTSQLQQQQQLQQFQQAHLTAPQQNYQQLQPQQNIGQGRLNPQGANQNRHQQVQNQGLSNQNQNQVPNASQRHGIQNQAHLSHRPHHININQTQDDDSVSSTSQNKRRKQSSNNTNTNANGSSNTNNNNANSSSNNTNNSASRVTTQASSDPTSLLDDTLGSVTRHVPMAISPATNTEKKGAEQRKIYDKEYAFIQAPTSVEEIWNEYSMGLNGQPSVKSLEMEYKTGWRRDPATSKKFNRRKAIYHAIERGVAKGFTVESCIRLLEDFRFLDREKNLKRPIGWLCHGNIPPELR